MTSNAIDLATTPRLRREAALVSQFALQLGQTQAIAASGGEVGAVFIGDSLTQNWAWTGDTWNSVWMPRRSLNYGIGGDQTGHLLMRLRGGLLDGIAPQAVVQLIGINNCWQDGSEDAVLAGISACLGAVREAQPATRVLVLGLLPLDQWAAHLDPLVQRINRLLPAVAREHRCDFRDVGAALRAADGRMTPGMTIDGCHLGAAGYAVLNDGVLAWYEGR